jgi:hypothetical protein
MVESQAKIVPYQSKSKIVWENEKHAIRNLPFTDSHVKLNYLF